MPSCFFKDVPKVSISTSCLFTSSISALTKLFKTGPNIVCVNRTSWNLELDYLEINQLQSLQNKTFSAYRFRDIKLQIKKKSGCFSIQNFVLFNSHLRKHLIKHVTFSFYIGSTSGSIYIVEFLNWVSILNYKDVCFGF